METHSKSLSAESGDKNKNVKTHYSIIIDENLSLRPYKK